MKLKALLVAACMAFIGAASAQAAPQFVDSTTGPALVAEFNLQARIDAAQAGDVIRVPAGVHTGSFALKDGVTLLGEGPGQSILDGAGAHAVVTGAKDAKLVGFTVRNGQAGILVRNGYMGIFQNHIADNAKMGIHIIGGSSVIANNLIEDNSGLGGVAVNSGNPYLLNNTIANNSGNGVWAWYAPGPVLLNNVLSGNGIASGSGAEVKTGYNLVDADLSVKLHETDKVANIEFANAAAGDFAIVDEDLAVTGFAQPGLNPAGEVGMAFSSKPTLAAYGRLMDQIEREVVYEHPVVTYDLTEDLGSFLVTTKFPTANFSVQSSTKDTVIESIQAFDAETDTDLAASFEADSEFPLVRVFNQQFTERGRDRYVLQNLYYHPGSYYATGKGGLVFSRETSFSRIEVVLPAGFVPANVSLPATFSETADGRVMVSMADIGTSTFNLHLVKSNSMLSDLYDASEFALVD